ncbi:hypothetical protein AGLY_015674, partial [Aphis glycines]
RNFDYIKILFCYHFFFAFINTISELLKIGCCSSSGTYDISKCSTSKFKNICHVFFCFSVSLSSWHINITVFGAVNSVIVFTNASTTFKNQYYLIMELTIRNNNNKINILLDNKCSLPSTENHKAPTQMWYPMLMQQFEHYLLNKACFRQHFFLIGVNFLVNLSVEHLPYKNKSHK